MHTISLLVAEKQELTGKLNEANSRSQRNNVSSSELKNCKMSINKLERDNKLKNDEIKSLKKVKVHFARTSFVSSILISV